MNDHSSVISGLNSNVGHRIGLLNESDLVLESGEEIQGRLIDFIFDQNSLLSSRQYGVAVQKLNTRYRKHVPLIGLDDDLVEKILQNDYFPLIRPQSHMQFSIINIEVETGHWLRISSHYQFERVQLMNLEVAFAGEVEEIVPYRLKGLIH